MARVVVLDADASSYRVIRHLLGDAHSVDYYGDEGPALEYVREQAPDVVFLNLDTGASDPFELLATMTVQARASSVVALMERVVLRRVVDAVQRGACDVITQPLQVRDVQLAVTRALARNQLRFRHAHGDPIPEIVGVSPAINRLRAHIQKVASGNGPVVITGESGVGKELVAQALHRLSPASGGRFEPRNCGAIPETLVEAELFGTERGAYTDAVQKPGAFELAHDGTLFLDEIGELSLVAQVKLLRVLETGGYYRVGGTRLQRSNVRFIAATHRDLAALRDQGRFRADLYYRIDVFRIHIPPLRDRPEDIPVITRHFMKVLRKRGVQSTASAFSASALRQLTEYDWPGNVRELRNVIWRAMVQATEPLIQLHDLTLG